MQVGFGWLFSLAFCSMSEVIHCSQPLRWYLGFRTPACLTWGEWRLDSAVLRGLGLLTWQAASVTVNGTPEPGRCFIAFFDLTWESGSIFPSSFSLQSSSLQDCTGSRGYKETVSLGWMWQDPSVKEPMGLGDTCGHPLEKMDCHASD